MNLKVTSFLSAILFGSVAFAQNYPEYINTKANHIEMNGADWGNLRDSVAQTLKGDTADFKILHIGDSHIQAEIVTNHLRGLLQTRYGNAGRGLIVPLRLAGTNQSHDYAFSATQPAKLTGARLLKCPWPVKVGVTGIGLRNDSAEVQITARTTRPGHSIKNATIIGNRIEKVSLGDMAADSIMFALPQGECLYGVITDNGSQGVLYSAIGNNGACYNDYLLIDSFAQQTKIFNPDLIILSMGTNEAFSTMSDQQVHTSVVNLVGQLRKANPSAQFLMLLPMECQKNRNHGHKPLSPYYDVNVQVKKNRDLLKATAKELGVPAWDLYEIAGGDGASTHWLNDKLMNKDRIHLYMKGYELMGDLLFDALIEALEN